MSSLVGYVYIHMHRMISYPTSHSPLPLARPPSPRLPLHPPNNSNNKKAITSSLFHFDKYYYCRQFSSRNQKYVQKLATDPDQTAQVKLLPGQFSVQNLSSMEVPQYMLYFENKIKQSFPPKFLAFLKP